MTRFATIFEASKQASKQASKPLFCSVPFAGETENRKQKTMIATGTDYHRQRWYGLALLLRG